MVVAVLPVGMMQVALHEIIYMICVRDALMAAGCTVNVIGLVRVAVMVRRALLRICGIA